MYARPAAPQNANVIFFYIELKPAIVWLTSMTVILAIQTFREKKRQQSRVSIRLSVTVLADVDNSGKARAYK